MPHFTLLETPFDKQNSDTTFVGILDGENCKTLDNFYLSIAKTLHFPDYFAQNLDSMDELLNDLSWLNPKTIYLIIRNYEDLLIEENEEVKEIILSLFDAAAEEWKEFGKGDKKLKFVIENSPTAAEELDAIGVEFKE